MAERHGSTRRLFGRHHQVDESLATFVTICIVIIVLSMTCFTVFLNYASSYADWLSTFPSCRGAHIPLSFLAVLSIFSSHSAVSMALRNASSTTPSWTTPILGRYCRFVPSTTLTELNGCLRYFSCGFIVLLVTISGRTLHRCS